MSCGVGGRRGSDPALLWLWCRPVATAPIGPPAWESPYAAGAAQEIAKKDKKELALGNLSFAGTQEIKLRHIDFNLHTKFSVTIF